MIIFTIFCLIKVFINSNKTYLTNFDLNQTSKFYKDLLYLIIIIKKSHSSQSINIP